MKKNSFAIILPVMFGFLAMGFIDMIGLVTNNVRADFNMSDGVVNTISLSCYLWFLLLSIPVGMALTKWGRKKMVLVSLGIHMVALILPYLSYSFASVLVAFSLIGIGNTILQVAMNPLVTDVVNADRVTSTITFGQATKAFGSIVAPFIAMWTAVSLGHWQLLFPIYAGLSLLGLVWLWLTPIEEQPREQKNVRVKDTLVLLKDRYILAFFFGIVVLVAADVAVNMTLPRLMTDQFGLSTDKANLCISLYFLARTVAAFAGGALLLKVNDRKFFAVGCWLAMLGLVLLAMLGKVGLVPALIAVCIFGIGYANLFGIVFSFAMRRAPEKANEVSALLIVGLIGGAILPPVLGWIRDISGSQIAAVAAIAVVWIYMLWLVRKIKGV
ncbi:MAG: MFS transporter [Bacteroidales bacterium]|nr:MFS transporter [Bacteroidales bacterium]